MLNFIQQDTIPIVSQALNKLEETTKKDSLLNIKLLEIGKYTLTVWDLVVIGIIIVVTFVVLKVTKRAILRNKQIDAGKQYSIYNLTKYIIVTFAVIWCLQTLGMNITLLLGGSAALLVGVGLGLQNLFSDFVSGIILLVDSSIKVGDIIDVNGLICKVKRINLRTTLVITRDDKYILLPNSQLTKNNIINWTHNVEATRFEINVGVGYDSDVELVRRLLLEIINNQPGVLKEPAPFIRFNDFSDSTLAFTIYFWSKDLFRVDNVKSDVRFKIYNTFNKYHIDISLPQRVIHFYDKERGDNFIRYTATDMLDENGNLIKKST